MMFQVDASSIQDFQSCRRKFILNSSWRLSRWRSKLLFDTLLRRAIFSLSKGDDVATVASTAKAKFLEIANDPGLDLIGKDPYQAAKGWISLLDSVLHGLARTELPVLHDPQPVRLTSSMEWKFLSWADDSGQLHRFLTVDVWDDEALSREMHSWRTFGDLVIGQVPLVLHVIILGQHRNGRHQSPWTRTYRHPAMPAIHWNFTKPEDTQWKPLYLADQNKVGMEDWIEMAWAQGAIQPLMQSMLVEQPTESVRRDTLSQIVMEASRMRELVGEDWASQPMSRGACDLYVPCPMQSICYSPAPVNISNLALYSPRKVRQTQSTEV